MADNLVTYNNSNKYFYVYSGITSTIIGSYYNVIASGPTTSTTLNSYGLTNYTSGINANYIVSTLTDQADGYGSICVFNRASPLLDRQFVGRDESTFPAWIPLGVGITSDSNIAVSVVFEENLFYFNGSTGQLTGSIDYGNQMRCITFDNDDNLVCTFNTTNDWIYTFAGSSSVLTGSFNTPYYNYPSNLVRDLEVDSDNNLLVLESSNNQYFLSKQVGITGTQDRAIQLSSSLTGMTLISGTLTPIVQIELNIDNTIYTDFRSLRISKSQGDYNTSSNFTAVFDSPYGRHSDTFNVGDHVVIRVDKISPPNNILFNGTIEKIKFKGRENTQTLEIQGRDYTQRLLDLTVEPVVYTDQEIGDIVKDIIANNCPYLTTISVNTVGATLKRMVFNQITIFSALSELAKLADYMFYVDEILDLHFEPKETNYNNITLNNTNILNATLDTTREGMANQIWIYGDRYLAGFTENLSFNGGSVYTLLSKPHDTLLEVTGIPQKGGIYDLNVEPISGTNYLVSYHDKQIYFTSGTNIGNSIPTNGESGIIAYNRELPIVRYGLDRNSINLYGPKTKVINDKTIKDPKTAVSILKKEIDNANPLKGLHLDIKGWYYLLPGQTVNVVLDDFNINEELAILNVDYQFTPTTIRKEDIISIKLDKKSLDITDQLSDLQKRLDLLESQDRQDTDLFTRFEFAPGSFTIIGSFWSVSTKTATGSIALLYSTNFIPTYPFKLASGTNQSTLAGSFTGSASSFGPYIIQASGGY